MPDQLIEFHLPEDIGGLSTKDFPRPIPAAQGMSPRLRSMPAEFENEQGVMMNTVKRCPPFTDAMSAGYLIPIVADVEFQMTDKGLMHKASLPIIDTHDPRQLAPDMERLLVLKFLNPWIVVTPPGWSSLFVAPLNRSDVPFQPLAGIVETDRFYPPVNFPTVCLLRPGQSFFLKRGTPFVQVIPIQRADWTSKIAVEDPQRAAEWDQLGERTGRYRAHKWLKKKYE